MGYFLIHGTGGKNGFIKLGLEEITVRVLEAGLNSLEYLRFAIADNALQRHLDLIETSRALIELPAQARSENATEPRGGVETTESGGYMPCSTGSVPPDRLLLQGQDSVEVGVVQPLAIRARMRSGVLPVRVRAASALVERSGEDICCEKGPGADG